MTHVDRRPVSVRRTIAAPRERVFAAWTEPDRIAAWFLDRDERSTESAKVEVDLRPGGMWRVTTGRGRGTWRAAFVYHEIIPPALLTFAPAAADADMGAPIDTPVVTISLDQIGDGGTRLMLRCTATDDEAADLANRWSSRVARLASHVVAGYASNIAPSL